MTIRLLRADAAPETPEAPAPFAEASQARDVRPDAAAVEAAETTEATEPAPAFPGNETLDGLARMAGVGELAREAGESVRPRNTLEELLTHELLAGHAFAMNVLCQANNQFLAVDARAGDFDHLTRLNQATAQTGMVGVRMMEAVQRGILLLDRLRHGIRYHHTVERIPAGRKSET